MGQEIPSYRDAAAGDSHQNISNLKLTGDTNKMSRLVLRAWWQVGSRGRCLPCVTKKPRFIIPMKKLEQYRSYMKYHALICKSIEVWTTEKDLIKWIEQKWKCKGHIKLKLGARGFFMVIFLNLQDKEEVFENAHYFHYNVGLFMRLGRMLRPRQGKNFGNPSLG